MSAVIFLDVDGVLNQLQKDYVDEKNVAVLAKIVKEIDGKIVLISSWRKGYVNVGKCSPQIDNLKEKLSKYGVGIIGRTRDLGDRASEIEDYISRYDVKRYVILDDDAGEYSHNVPGLYIVNYKTGLVKGDIKSVRAKVVG